MYGNGSNPQRQAIGKNLSNEEYLKQQSELNRMRRLQDQQSRERQDQKKVQEREAGFNVYLSGANEKRIADQRQREKYGNNFTGAGSQGNRQGSQARSGSRGAAANRNDSKGARRRWLAPQGGASGNETSIQDSSIDLSDAKKSNYQNPFMINDNQSNASPFTGPNIPKPSNQPSGRRKQWGADAQKKQDVIGTNFLDSNTPDDIQRKNENAIKKLSLSDSEEEVKRPQQQNEKIAIVANDDDDDDDYSDSFEEVNATVETVQNQGIEDLLKTATEDQLNILKESLGNWADVKQRMTESIQSSAQKGGSKLNSAQKNGANLASSGADGVFEYQQNQVNQTLDDDDYIEEDFEEDKSDSPIEDATSDDAEEERLELERLEQQRKISNRIQSTRPSNKPTRPISATYSLSNNLSKPPQKTSQSNLGFHSTNPYNNPQKANTLNDKQAMLSALEEENRKAIQSRRPAASATNYKGPGVITSIQQPYSGNLGGAYGQPVGHLDSIAERQKLQNNNAASSLAMPVGGNPFATKGRPISQMLPKRQGEKHQKSKTMHQQNMPKMADHQNFMTDTNPTANQNNSYQQPHESNQRSFKSNAHPNYTIDEQEIDDDTTFTRNELGQSEIKDSSIYKHPSNVHKNPAGKETVTIAELLGQIQKLEDSQRHHLFLCLKEMETTGDMSASNLQNNLQQFLTKNAEKNAAVAAGQTQSSSMKKEQIVSEQQPKERIHNEVVLRVMSTLGNPHVCGLTEIELFDEYAQKIPLVASCVMVRNQGKGPKVSVDKLINGNKLTKDDKQMWLGYLPMPPSHLEIMIRFDKATKIGGIKIWNYNKGILDCTKGVYELQVLVNDTLKWSGQLSPGKGQINVDYSKSIVLKDGAEAGFELPKEAIPEPTPTQAQANNILKPQAQPSLLSNAQSMKQFGSVELEDPKSTDEKLKQYRSKLELAQGINNQSAANLNPASGPIWLDQDPKPRGARDSNKRQSELRDDPKMPVRNLPGQNAGFKAGSNSGVPRRGNDNAIGEINSIVRGAVDSVNKAVEMSNSKRKEPRKPALVDESLDSLDFFKVTNLGRFHNTKEQASSTKQQSRIQSFDKRDSNASNVQAKNTRTKWGNSIDNNQQSIHSSSRKNDGGPVIKSGALPDEFMMPSPARSIPSRKSKKGRDVLDDFMGVKVENPTSQFTNQHTRNNNPPINQFQQQEAFDMGQQQTQEAAFKADSFKVGNQQVEQEQFLETREVQAPSRIMKDEDDNHNFSDDQSTDETATVIPTLPQGKKLEINILETWGDMNYLGLTGIEVFDELGMPINLHENQILAFPPDVNVLPGYGTDPRTIEKLVDGQYFTNDDLHVWLTPFTSGEDHQISINLGKYYGISMIRIWNYNKSRIHSYRGAKLVQMELDGQTIFRGEIKKAPGAAKNPEDCCEIILFTEDDAVLEMIDQNDWLNDLDIAADEFDNTQRINEFQIQEGQLEERPMTATKKFSNTEIEELQFQLQQQQSKPTSLFDERPMTSAIVQSQRIGMPSITATTLDAVQEEEPTPQNRSSLKQQPYQVKKPSNGVRGQVLLLNITQSWGDLFYVGLNGLEVMDENGRPIPITVDKNTVHSETGQICKTQVKAEPRDMNSIPGHASDHRTLEKLFNGTNNTVDDRNMWLVPFNTGEDHTIRIDLGHAQTITALKFFNYNKSVEDSLRGAKQVIIRLDDKLVTPKKGITLRIAPGTINGIEDIGQQIKLPYTQGWQTDQIIPVQRSLDSQANQVQYMQEYEPIAMPMGFMFKLNLYSTHGDLFYIGLNGIEVYDQNGFEVCRTRKDQFKVYAHPAGVHTLTGMNDDIRIVQNLVDGSNQTESDNHIWLTPYKNTKGHANASAPEKDTAKRREPNYIVLLFEQPVALSALRIWNYAKTPARGVNEYELEIDGQKIYRGFAKRAPDHASNEIDWSSTVLFQGDARNADSLGRQINFSSTKVQNVLLMNERKQMNAQHQKAHVNEKFVFDEQLRPQTKAFFK